MLKAVYSKDRNLKEQEKAGKYAAYTEQKSYRFIRRVEEPIVASIEKKRKRTDSFAAPRIEEKFISLEN